VIAEAFDQGILKVMVATCSLAAGINLPARGVVLNDTRVGRELVGPAMLHQMRGRAGKKGKDEIGETYLCCQNSDLEAVADLLEAELPPVQSCLAPDNRGVSVKGALLEVVCIQLANSREAINDYIHHSILYQTIAHVQMSSMADAAMDSLFETRLVKTTTYGALEPTKLGQAIVASSLTPEDVS
jgi:replicative superfamily II helicase